MAYEKNYPLAPNVKGPPTHIPERIQKPDGVWVTDDVWAQYEGEDNKLCLYYTLKSNPDFATCLVTWDDGREEAVTLWVH